MPVLQEAVNYEVQEYTKRLREPHKDPDLSSFRSTELEVFPKIVDNFQSGIAGKHVYRYRQVCKVDGRGEIPIYGSSVVAEAKGKEITVSSAQVDKKVADPIFQTPSQLKIENEGELQRFLSEQLGPVFKEIDLNPTLYYYYDISHKQEGKWRLVWVTDIPTKQFEHIEGKDFLSKLADYIVDAKSGEIVDKLSHVRS